MTTIEELQGIVAGLVSVVKELTTNVSQVNHTVGNMAQSVPAASNSHSLRMPSIQLPSFVILHGKTGIKVIARSQHASTRKQKNLDLARLKRVQEHTSLLSSFVWLDTRRTKERAPTNNAVKQRSVLNLKNKR